MATHTERFKNRQEREERYQQLKLQKTPGLVKCTSSEDGKIVWCVTYSS